MGYIASFLLGTFSGTMILSWLSGLFGGLFGLGGVAG